MLSVIETITEEETSPIRDDNGNFHNHDGNDGSVELTCINGHISTQMYIASCECGWNAINESKSCETFEKAKTVPNWNLDDEDFMSEEYVSD